MRWLALVLALCAGCDQLFDIHTLALSPDAPPGPDAKVPPDGPQSGPRCSPITMLADDFTSDRLATVWPQTNALASNQVTVQDGQLLMINAAVDSYATLDPGRYYDLRDNYFSARIDDDHMMDTADYVMVELDSERAGYRATISRDDANVTITSYAPSGPPMTLARFPFDSATQPYVRAGVVGNMLVFETAPDGIAWTQHAMLADASGFTFVHPTIQTHRGVSSPQFTVYVDDVDGGVAMGAACPISKLHDDFMAIELADQWARSPHTAGMITPIGGIADVETTGKSSNAGLVASTVYDLSNGSISVEIPVMIVNSTQNTVTLRVTTGTGDSISIAQTNRIMALSVTSNGGTSSMSLSYDPNVMRWWKIGNAAGTLTWQFSSDGVMWQLYPATSQLTGLDRCDIAIVVTSNSGNPGDTQLDNVNLP